MSALPVFGLTIRDTYQPFIDDAFEVTPTEDGWLLRVSTLDLSDLFSGCSVWAITHGFNWYNRKLLATDELGKWGLGLIDRVENETRRVIRITMSVSADGQIGQPVIEQTVLGPWVQMSVDDFEAALADGNPMAVAMFDCARALVNGRRMKIRVVEQASTTALNKASRATPGRLVMREQNLAAGRVIGDYFIARGLPGIFRNCYEEKVPRGNGLPDATYHKASYAAQPGSHAVLKVENYLPVTSVLESAASAYNQWLLMRYLTGQLLRLDLAQEVASLLNLCCRPHIKVPSLVQAPPPPNPKKKKKAAKPKEQEVTQQAPIPIIPSIPFGTLRKRDLAAGTPSKELVERFTELLATNKLRADELCNFLFAHQKYGAQWLKFSEAAADHLHSQSQLVRPVVEIAVRRQLVPSPTVRAAAVAAGDWFADVVTGKKSKGNKSRTYRSCVWLGATCEHAETAALREFLERAAGFENPRTDAQTARNEWDRAYLECLLSEAGDWPKLFGDYRLRWLAEQLGGETSQSIERQEQDGLQLVTITALLEVGGKIYASLPQKRTNQDVAHQAACASLFWQLHKEMPKVRELVAAAPANPDLALQLAPPNQLTRRAAHSVLYELGHLPGWSSTVEHSFREEDGGFICQCTLVVSGGQTVLGEGEAKEEKEAKYAASYVVYSQLYSSIHQPAEVVAH